MSRSATWKLPAMPTSPVRLAVMAGEGAGVAGAAGACLTGAVREAAPLPWD
jgi:hypothetical protein